MRKRLRTSLVFAAALLAAPALFAQTTPDHDADQKLGELSLEELMEVPIVSASNTSERLLDAPANVIVLTRDDIRQRGYSDFSEILDDLPGMDVVRPYGATYLKNYWRGYRNTIGDPFLIMVDGIIFNHLYFNTADVLATFPLSNIERVEVVYGPASSVYGANAFMGVINVITAHDRPTDGSSQSIRIGAGSFGTRLADATVLYRDGDRRVMFSTRFDNGELDPSIADRYEYLGNKYYADRSLWGGFAQNPSLGGRFSSPRRNRAADLRVFLGDLEAGVQYFVLDAGYGAEYAADRAQNHATWARPDLSAHLRYKHDLSDSLSLTTLLRYRSSDVSNDSFFVAAASENDQPRKIDFSYWSSQNSSLSLYQDFDFRYSDRISFTTGLKYEEKDLQKAYETTYGPSLPPSEVDGARYPYPDAPGGNLQAQNRLTTEDWGVYLQSWYRATPRQRINLGVRVDRNSKYGSATTLRGSYVATMGPWGFKGMYGEAFEEPNQRLLYGGWDGSGSDPMLNPERSSTIEASASYSRSAFSSLVSVYYVRNKDTFVNTQSGALNLGDRDVLGFDYGAQARLFVRGASYVKAWGYFSRIIRAEEEKVDEFGFISGEGSIGDLARESAHAGVTWVGGPHITATMRARYAGPRTPVETNPVRHIGGATTADAYLRFDDVLADGIGISLSVSNLFDRKFDDPGVRDANAGIRGGRFDHDEVWHGSGGFFNSLLPQPGRSILLSLHFDSAKSK